MDLCDQDGFQQDMFSQSKESPELMQCIDDINARFGRDSVHLAGRGIEQKFAMKREFLSPQYTTQWKDLPTVKC